MITTTNISDNNEDDHKTLVFPIHYFEGVKEFKDLIHGLREDFIQLIGNTKVMFAMKKGTSVGASLVRNKALCNELPTDVGNQKCNAQGCQQCPLVNTEHKLSINNTNISIPAL